MVIHLVAESKFLYKSSKLGDVCVTAAKGHNNNDKKNNDNNNNKN